MNLTIKQIILQLWNKCKSTFPTINDTDKSENNVYSSNKVEEIISTKINEELEKIDVAEEKLY